MAFQSVPSTVEAVVRMLINSQVVTMTFYGFFPSGYALADVGNLASEMDDWANTELKPRLSSASTYVGVNCRGLEAENDLEVFDDTNTGVGSGATQPAPNNVALAVKRSSIFTGRSARGRVYFPLNLGGIDGTDENRVSAGTATSILATLNAVRTYMLTAGATEVIVSRYSAGVKRATGITFTVVSYERVNDVLNTQRRRLPKS